VLPTSSSFHRGLYQRICARIVHPMGVNISLCTSLAIKIWWSYGLTYWLPPPPQMAQAPYMALLPPRPLPTNMSQHITPQCRHFRPMDVLRSQNLATLWAEIALYPHPHMANSASMFPIPPRPVPANMRQYTTPQGCQYKPMEVTCSRNLVELWVEMLAPPSDGHHTLYLSHFTPASTAGYAPALYSSGPAI
jgi:hypothetical protein